MKKQDVGGNSLPSENKELVDEFISHFKNSFVTEDEASLFTEQSCFERMCIRVIAALIGSKLSIVNVVHIVKDSGIRSDPHKIRLLLSTIWLFSSQVKDPSTSGLQELRTLAILLKDLINAGIIEQGFVKGSMDFSLLAEAGLIKDEEGHNKRVIKANTSLVYKQQKYNLLREELEGYSKLVVLLENHCHSVDDLDFCLSQMLSIIGHFELDPNRVLDILLDLFEHEPHNLCYLELLKQFHLGNVAHVLGNKFLAYHQDDQVHSAGTPHSLYFLSAVLLAAEIVQLPSILCYVLPSLEVTVDAVVDFAIRLKTDFATSTASPVVMQRCACAMEAHGSSRRLWLTRAPLAVEAGAVFRHSDNTMQSGGSGSGPRPPPPAFPPPLSVLMAGNAPSALPVTTDLKVRGEKDPLKDNDRGNDRSKDREPTGEVEKAAEPATVAEVVYTASNNQLLGLCVALAEVKAWNLLRSVLGLFIEHNDAITMDLILCFCPALAFAIADMLAWSTYRLLNAIAAPINVGDGDANERFGKVPCLPAAQHPQLQELSDLLDHVQPLVTLLDYHIAENPYAYSQLVILSERYLVQHTETPDQVDKACRLILHPLLRSLAVSGHNATYYSMQVWQVLKILPFHTRFAIYETLQSRAKPLLVLHAEKTALQGVRHEMKRLAKENTKQIGRNLSKYLHSNPNVVITHVLNQIESFDNLVPYIVEALKFSTDLSRDVCALALVSKLKTNVASKIKAGQTTYSPWFLSLSKFIATFYGKFPATEVKGLLHYLLKSVQSGGSADLLVLKDLFAIMGGCTTLLDVSSTQLEGLAGGKVLRSEVLSCNNNSTVSAKQTKKSGSILRDELLASGTALPLLLFIAQIRSRVLFEQDEMPLKLISQLYDTAQDVLMQFSDFLVTDGKALQTIASVMPSFPTLVHDIRLSMSVAFQLVRPLVRSALQSGYDNHTQVSGVMQGWHPFSSDIASFIRLSMESSNVWRSVSERLFLLFWSLSVYDIQAPSDRYHTEIKRLKDKYAELDSKKHTGAGGSSSSEQSRLVRQREADMKALMNTVASLSEENVAQKRHVEHIRKMMFADKDSYFSGSATVSEVVEAVMQHMVMSRMLLSPSDAVYSVKFLYLLHDVGVSGFCLLSIYNEIVRSFVSLLFGTTEAEASFIGYALNEVIQIANSWADSKAAFHADYLDKSCLDDCAIADLISDAASRAAVADGDSHCQLVALVKDWHTIICAALDHSFAGRDYIYVRSGLITLSKISPSFPHYASHGKKLIATLDALISREAKREDLQIMARSVSVVFRRKNTNWVDDSVGQSLPEEENTRHEGVEELGKAYELKEEPVVVPCVEPNNSSRGSNREKTEAVMNATGKASSESRRQERSASKPRGRAHNQEATVYTSATATIAAATATTTYSSQEPSIGNVKRKSTEGVRSQTPPGKVPRRGGGPEKDQRDDKRDDSRERRQQPIDGSNHQQSGGLRKIKDNQRSQQGSLAVPPNLTVPASGYAGSTYSSNTASQHSAEYNRRGRSRDNRDTGSAGLGDLISALTILLIVTLHSSRVMGHSLITTEKVMIATAILTLRTAVVTAVDIVKDTEAIIATVNNKVGTNCIRAQSSNNTIVRRNLGGKRLSGVAVTILLICNNVNIRVSSLFWRFMFTISFIAEIATVSEVVQVVIQRMMMCISRMTFSILIGGSTVIKNHCLDGASMLNDRLRKFFQPVTVLLPAAHNFVHMW
eukprot:gene26855-32454_t